MHSRIPLLLEALWFCGISVSAVSVGSTESNPKPGKDFGSFAQALGVSASQISCLAGKYAAALTDNALLDLACLTAGVILGEEQVQSEAVNQTVVDVNWSETCWAEPYCVIQPRNESDVSVALQIIDFFESKFAVRSGGHSPNPGWSSVDSTGILVDLQRLNSIQLSSDGSVASVGPGARWGDVYATLDAHQAVVIGARIPEVGVGGSILGGGFFHISNEFGLAVDNVKNFEVVLSDGSIVNANNSTNTDLFWALKGGGPNFGIVTRYDLYTVPVYEVWAQALVFSLEQAPEVLVAFNKWQNNGSRDSKSSASFQGGLQSITLLLIYAEPIPGVPDAFAPFYELQALAPVVPPANVTFNEVNMILAAATSTAPGRHAYRGCSSRVNVNLTIDVFDFWLGKAQQAYSTNGVNQTFVIQHVPANLVQQGINRGGNALSLPLEDVQWWTTIVDWDGATDDDSALSVSIETTTQWETLGAQLGSNLSFVFMNDAARDQNPLSGYGVQSLDRLRKVSQQYDQSQLFQRHQNSGFLLSRA